MRILHILNDVTDRGNGIVNTAIDLAIEQARQGSVVAVASAGGGYEHLLERAGVLHLHVDQSRRPTRILRALPLLHRHIRHFRPDIVHAHMRTGLMLAWLCAWLRARHNRFALIGHVHNVHDRESIVMGLADRVIAVSQSVARTMADRGIQKQKICVVLNRTLGNRRQLPLDAITPAVLAAPSIVTVCGMSHRKGIEELIAAFELVAEQCPSAHLYLVGDGPQRSLLESIAHRSRWSSQIHFEGFQPVPQAYMLSADVFVLASRRESFGLVLVEARQAGCAIVATDVDGIAEALEGGQAGILVPAQNVEALASALCRVLQNPLERSAWQRKARQGIGMYSVHVMASQVQDVYAQLIGNETCPDSQNTIFTTSG